MNNAIVISVADIRGGAENIGGNEAKCYGISVMEYLNIKRFAMATV